MDTKALRQKILDLAIHGKLVPQDPNDEPASVLLERIKAEKERLIKEGKIKRSKKSAKTSDTPHYQNVPFEVPSSWVWCKLEDYVKSVTDGDHQAPPKSDIGIPFLVISDVAKGKLNFLNTRFVPQEYYEKISFDRKPEKGDLLFTVTGSYGIVVPVNIDCKFCFQRHIGLIKTLNTSEYLLHLLKSSYFKGQCDEFATGTAQKTVGLETLRSFLLPIPPFAEQQRIVIEIEKWFSLIELIEGGKDDLQTTIKQAKSKILDLAIHGKLVPQDPNEEPAIKLLKRINPDFTPCDNGHYTQLPNGWTVAPMQVLCSLVDGDKQKGIERINLDVKYLRGERDAKTLTSGKYVTANSLLILVDGENSGEVFRTSIDGYQGSTFKQLLINENMNEEYVLQAINLHRKVLRESKVGSAIPHLNKKLFKAIEIPIPPYKEQQRIIKAITKAFMSLDLIMESL
ncbi:restriction endonuclease subunit S [Bacteroides thetaiotaomicron]|uniref:restriction endonuclease subunit S n=1 Tax=Bacteroides thetaiotaomicron TaxID=818 RepID=UPI00135E4276|nr:restriction endonuclease subunit S [Bacteroides thetaiotaomicron]KAB4518447.1 restriction endonuclease subunit S [Bacteroides thetaiotaomicron]MCE8711938.1 restriction endonuclease subunit S [Bacteroides thetaiotaomicron]MCG4874066.1 restriction endonuclease subunit S [Bacteroides thetaiotaomicron]MCS3230717.1 restriction endonuclease subunit S [Bacteroides thetaiotaomicron]UVS15236.1 restriction endonuclease subunit S [Bacteroides thetaiotaomicron]